LYGPGSQQPETRMTMALPLAAALFALALFVAPAEAA
jgi:hypothetical protein